MLAFLATVFFLRIESDSLAIKSSFSSLLNEESTLMYMSVILMVPIMTVSLFKEFISLQIYSYPSNLPNNTHFFNSAPCKTTKKIPHHKERHALPKGGGYADTVLPYVRRKEHAVTIAPSSPPEAGNQKL